jgi:hypothetical protein
LALKGTAGKGRIGKSQMQRPFSAVIARLDRAIQ